MAELKPCPFCGGEAELDAAQSYRAISGGAIGSRAAIYCTRCGADMGFCYEDAPGTPREDIVNQVVDDWNRRSPSPAPDMREAVEDETAVRIIFYAVITINGQPFSDTQVGKAWEQCQAIWSEIKSSITPDRSLTGAKP